jgi:hypothetical protein
MKCVTCGLSIKEDKIVDGHMQYIHTETAAGVRKAEFYNCSFATGKSEFKGVATPVKKDDDYNPPPPPPPQQGGEGEHDSELEGQQGGEGQGESQQKGQEQKQGQGKEDKKPQQEKEQKPMGRPKKNPEQKPKSQDPKEYKYSELEHGKFYLLKGSNDGTLYTKSLQGDTVWFHESQVGVFVKDQEPNKDTARFLLAPSGMPPIVLVQEACIFA